MTEINKEYFEGFGQYIDNLSDKEFIRLLEESGLNECPMEEKNNE